MTIKQAKSELMQIYGALSPDKQRAIDTLVKIEPCEDAISRQAVLNINESHHGQMSNHINHQIWQEIKDLPPVNPQEPKIGHWLPYAEIDGKTVKWVCSSCRRIKSTTKNKTEYCPVCGARMFEPQESEDK